MKLLAPRFLSSRWLAIAMGPLAALLAHSLIPPGAHPLIPHTAAIAVWMAAWWILEAVPLAVTALIPLVLMPALGILSGEQTAALYTNSTVFLLLGGFVIALAVENSGLHRRVALSILTMARGSAGRLLWGFLLTGALISMWMSNTAVAILLAPIALSVIGGIESGGGSNTRGLSAAIALSIAYGASIGGIGTPVGSPPNLVFMQQYHLAFPEAPVVSFAEWTALCTPLMLAMLACAWLILRLTLCRGACLPAKSVGMLREDLQGLGRMSRDELLVGLVFCIAVILWLVRAPLDIGTLHIPGWGRLLPADTAGKMLSDDGTVAIFAATLLFMLPSARKPGTTLVNWSDSQRLPWGTMLLFGGGFALAGGMMASGFSEWCGQHLAGLTSLPLPGLILSVYLFTTITGELASNTAVAQIVLPIAAAASRSAGIIPLLLMLPVALASSLDFILPAATPPNAIAIATGKVNIRQMVGVGIIVELTTALLTTVAVLAYAAAHGLI